jgi:hypothetical protein
MSLISQYSLSISARSTARTFALYLGICAAIYAICAASSAWCFSPSQTAAAYAAAGLKHKSGKLFDECDTAVKPTMETVKLGGEVGDAIMLQIEDPSCYGMVAVRLVLLRVEGDRLTPIFDNNSSGVTVLKSSHLGVADIELHVPGMKIPIWRWNGKQYHYWKSVPG